MPAVLLVEVLKSSCIALPCQPDDVGFGEMS
jgi:hypothetical protein